MLEWQGAFKPTLALCEKKKKKKLRHFDSFNWSQCDDTVGAPTQGQWLTLFGRPGRKK